MTRIGRNLGQRPGRRRRGRAVGKPRGVLFVYAVAIGTIIFFVAQLAFGYITPDRVPGRSYYDLTAEFDNADNLLNHYSVRIGGRRAGQVLDPKVEDGKAVMTMRLDKEYQPLLSDTKMRVRLRSAVGVRYLELIPGTKGEPLPHGATIAADNAVSSVALDEVLGVFDGQTRARTQQLLRELGTSVAGRGEALGDMFTELPRFLTHTGNVAKAITDRPQAMRRLVHALGDAATAFEPAARDIGEGFDPEARALRPFNTKREEFSEMLDELPPTLTALRTQLPATTRLLSEVDGLARDAHPTLVKAPAALSETTRLLRTAGPPLSRTDDTLRLVDRAADPALDMLRRFQPALPQIDRAIDDLRPVLDYVGPRACELSNVWSGWHEGLRLDDGLSNSMRFDLGLLGLDVQPGGIGEIKLGAEGMFDRWRHTNPYPGPCRGEIGETGIPLKPTPEQFYNGYIAGPNGPEKMPGFTKDMQQVREP